MSLLFLHEIFLHAGTSDEDEPRGAQKKEVDINDAVLSQPGLSQPRRGVEKIVFMSTL